MRPEERIAQLLGLLDRAADGRPVAWEGRTICAVDAVPELAKLGEQVAEADLRIAGLEDQLAEARRPAGPSLSLATLGQALEDAGRRIEVLEAELREARAQVASLQVDVETQRAGARAALEARRRAERELERVQRPPPAPAPEASRFGLLEID